MDHKKDMFPSFGSLENLMQFCISFNEISFEELQKISEYINAELPVLYHGLGASYHYRDLYEVEYILNHRVDLPTPKFIKSYRFDYVPYSIFDMHNRNEKVGNR